MKLPVLVILHQEHSTPGRVGLRLSARGYRLDIRRPRFGDPLPETLAGHAGAIVFGGPMSANDSDDYIRGETEWIGVPLSEGAPFLGLCLGGQMLARHLGAAVGPDPQGRVEIGYYDIRPTEAGRRLLSPWPDRVHHFHREGFALPAGATLLAEGDIFPNQAFAVGGTAFALQFHIELTMAMVGRWTGRIGERARLPGAQPPGEHLAGRALHDWKTAAFLDRFLDFWLATDLRRGIEADRTVAAVAD
jgi:GMP synthase (glutamine-hydrolysing)